MKAWGFQLLEILSTIGMMMMMMKMITIDSYLGGWNMLKPPKRYVVGQNEHGIYWVDDARWTSFSHIHPGHGLRITGLLQWNHQWILLLKGSVEYPKHRILSG